MEGRTILYRPSKYNPLCGTYINLCRRNRQETKQLPPRADRPHPSPAQDLRNPDDERRPQAPAQARQQKRHLALRRPHFPTPIAARHPGRFCGGGGSSSDSSGDRLFRLPNRQGFPERGDGSVRPVLFQGLVVLAALGGGQGVAGGWVRRDA